MAVVDEKKSKAASTLAKDNVKKSTKSKAAKVLASDSPDLTVAEKVKDAAIQAPVVAKAALHQVAEVDVADHTNQVTELVAEGADTVADSLHHVAEVSRKLTPKQIGIVTGAVVVGVAVGGYVGYRLAEKKLSLKFEELLEKEAKDLRDHYQARTMAKEEQSKEDLSDIVEHLGYTPQGEPITTEPATPAGIMNAARHNEAGEREAPKVEVEVKVQNAFENQPKPEVEVRVWDYAEETKKRDPRFPYVVHIDEFRENEGEYDKIELTWYEGDEVLTNEADQIMGDVDEAIGNDNLEKFGHGSGDPNVVFVRNDVREIMYEINRTDGMYAVMIQGFDQGDIEAAKEIRHSYERKGRFSDDD